MSLASASDRNDYTGNGATSVYSYGFKIFLKTDLEVTKRTDAGVETTLVVDTDYTVSGVGDTAGGSVTLVAGNLTSGYHLTIRRVRPLTQTTDIRNQGDFYPETLEDALDHLVMIAQQLQDEIDRSVKLATSVADSVFNPTLPTELTPDAVFAVNEDGDGFVMGPTVGTIENASVSAAAAAASESNAGVSATLAANHATTASRYATYTGGTVVNAATGVDSGEYSAKKYAQDAASAAAAVTSGTSGSRAAPNDVVAGTGVVATADRWQTQFIIGTGGVVVSANPQISAGSIVGSRLTLIGRSDTNFVTLSNGNGLSLNGSITLYEDDVIELVWDGTNWCEVFRRR